MPRQPAPLPEPFRGRAFSVYRTEPRLTRGRSRAADLSSPFYGTRLPRYATTLLDRCRAKATRLPPFAVYSHATAARIHALPIPVDDDDLHISVPTDRRAPRGHGVVGHAVALADGDWQWRGDVRVTTAARTLCDMSAALSLPRLVAIADDILHRRLATPDQLHDAVTGFAGRRHRAALRRVLELMDAAAESPKESELRVRLMDAGFDRPACNVVVRDARGAFVARVDLAYPDLKIAIEYEGDHHRDRAQWRRDLRRRRRLEALGWTYLAVTQADLDDLRALASDLRAALASARRPVR